jgi:hypothetical protein
LVELKKDKIYPVVKMIEQEPYLWDLFQRDFIGLTVGLPTNNKVKLEVRFSGYFSSTSLSFASLPSWISIPHPCSLCPPCPSLPPSSNPYQIFLLWLNKDSLPDPNTNDCARVILSRNDCVSVLGHVNQMFLVIDAINGNPRDTRDLEDLLGNLRLMKSYEEWIATTNEHTVARFWHKLQGVVDSDDEIAKNNFFEPFRYFFRYSSKFSGKFPSWFFLFRSYFSRVFRSRFLSHLVLRETLSPDSMSKFHIISTLLLFTINYGVSPVESFRIFKEANYKAIPEHQGFFCVYFKKSRTLEFFFLFSGG